MIDPDTIAKVYVSPLLRARETLALLNLPASIPVEITDLLHEFRYGDFEGMKTSEIKQLTGNAKWETWVDPAPGAETPEEVQHRIDELIRRVRFEDHQHCFVGPSARKNVLLVARIMPRHLLLTVDGHILRGYAARWIDLRIQSARSLQLDAGGEISNALAKL